VTAVGCSIRVALRAALATAHPYAATLTILGPRPESNEPRGRARLGAVAMGPFVCVRVAVAMCSWAAAGSNTDSTPAVRASPVDLRASPPGPPPGGLDTREQETPYL